MAEPYDYKIGGKTVLMTTLSTPILQDGKYLGAVTVDVALAALQQRLGALRPMQDGYVELLSPAGVVLASHDTTRIGKQVTDARHRTMLEAIKAGKDALDFTPMQTAQSAPTFRYRSARRRSASRWAWWCRMPRSCSRRITCCGPSLPSALVRRWCSAWRCSRCCVARWCGRWRPPRTWPMRSPSGKLDNQITVQRQDEVGRLMGAMQRMQSDLRERIERDAQVANENLRIRTALEHSEMEVLLADEQHNAVFITQALHTSFKQGEPAFHAKGQTGFSADAVVGKPMDYVFGNDSEGTARTQRLRRCSPPAPNAIASGR